MKGFWTEFKKFITRGNVLDMAIGVIVGGSFNTIVTTLNQQVLMPVINWGLSYINDGSELCTVLPNYVLYDPLLHEGATPIVVNGISYYTVNYINWSALIESIFNFFFIALTLFIILKVFTYVSKKRIEIEQQIMQKIKNKNTENEATEE
jgi:large conductance mechanosensitive channel